MQYTICKLAIYFVLKKSRKVLNIPLKISKIFKTNEKSCITN